jgi:para-nitrobenzyl esterase
MRTFHETRDCLLTLLAVSSIACSSNTEGNSGTPYAGDAASEGGVDQAHVTIGDGQLEGKVDGAAHAFLGIPYAKPPVRDLRWKPPQAVDKWSGVRKATQFGKRCAQLASATLQNAASQDEDCLYLNVWTPDVGAQKLPVMVWIHGGGNVNGSASEPVPFVNTGFFYSGSFLSGNHGVVVVSFNYRLGIFGFLAHPGLSAEGSKPGNQGLWDQRFALEWVKANIDKFGGDPGNVTIFGESAGSLDVCLHVASPQTQGLFHKAISESGGCTTRQAARADAETTAASIATQLGCSGDGALGCLRTKQVPDLLNATPAMNSLAGAGLGPIVDGDFFPDQPRTLYDSGNISKVPFILGSNTDEGTLFAAGGQAITTQDQLTAALSMTFTSGAAQIAQEYPVTKFSGAQPNQYQAALSRAVGDSILVCTTYDAAVRAAKANAPAVYMYNFDVPFDPAITPGIFLGATHGSELAFVFGTSTKFTADTKAVSDRMRRYWTNFAKTGDPNGGGGDLTWPKFSDTTNVRINFGLQSTIVTDFRAEECAFWRSRYDAQFTMPPTGQGDAGAGDAGIVSTGGDAGTAGDAGTVGDARAD